MDVSIPRRRRPQRPINPEHLSLLAGSGVLLLLVVAGMGAPRNWWAPNLELHVRTDNAAGIKPGMPVMISGYPVGQVQRIRLLNNAQVDVTLQVAASRNVMLGRRSRASLEQDSLLSTTYIAISPDPEGQRSPLAQGHLLSFEPNPGLNGLIKELAANRRPLQDVINNTARLVGHRMPHSLDQLDRTLSSGNRLASSVERELVGRSGNLQRNVDDVTKTLEGTLGTLESTLVEVRGLARSSNALLQGISRSWLLRLLEPAPVPSAPQADPTDLQLRNKRE